MSKYDEDPVFYCKRCLSLAIRRIDGSDSECYCNDCMNTEIGLTDIHTWELMYENKYGVKYINK